MDNRTEPLADGVWRIEVGTFTNAYLIARDGRGDGRGLLLVDAGRRRTAPRLVRSVRLLGFEPRRIDTLLLTHWHVDHAGAAAGLAASSARTTVRARPPDDVIVAGRGEGRARGPRAPGRRARLAERYPRGPAAVATTALADGETLPGAIQVVAAPGHTSGHTAFWLPERGVLLAGDALATVLKVSTGTRALAAEPAAVPATLRRLAGLAPTVVGVGHGPPVRSQAPQQLTALADRAEGKRPPKRAGR